MSSRPAAPAASPSPTSRRTGWSCSRPGRRPAWSCPSDRTCRTGSRSASARSAVTPGWCRYHQLRRRNHAARHGSCERGQRRSALVTANLSFTCFLRIRLTERIEIIPYGSTIQNPAACHRTCIDIAGHAGQSLQRAFNDAQDAIAPRQELRTQALVSEPRISSKISTPAPQNLSIEKGPIKLHDRRS